LSLWIEVLGGWYDYAIEELEALLRRCPEDVWLQNVWEVKQTDRVVERYLAREEALERVGKDDYLQAYGACWQVAFHTVLALDAYLSPTLPFEPLRSFENWDGLPTSPYRRSDVLEYLSLCRTKARDTFASVTDESAAKFRSDEPFASALVRGLMHLREHTGQLAVFIGAGPESP
jgi:hypothetical protein